jgi:PAS domain S-box-containing protein/putative nucleotidyltransferase with HDIG domain
MKCDSEREKLYDSKPGSKDPCYNPRKSRDPEKGSPYFPERKPQGHKRAEEKLKESEERLRSLIESLPHIIWETDTAGNLTFVNSRAFDSFGYTQDDFDRGLNALQMIAPKDRAKAGQNIQKVLTGEKVAVEEYEALRIDGTTFPVLIQATPILKGGKSLGLRGVIMDVSDRKKAEAELRESEHRFRTAFESSNDGITIVRGDECLYVNKKFLEILGYENSDQVFHEMPFAWLHPDDRKRVMEFNKRKQEDQTTPDRYEVRGIKKDGQLVHLEVSAARMKLRRKIFFLLFLHDITMRRQMQEHLEEQREMFHTILENELSGVALIESSGKYLYVNPEFTRITGYAIEDIPTGREFFRKAFPEPDYRKRVISQWKNDRRAMGRGVDRHFKIACKNGQAIDVEFRTTFLKDSTITNLRDITAQKKAEEERDESEEKLRKMLGGTVQAMALAIESRDPYTSGHQKRVSGLARRIAQEMQLEHDIIECIRIAGIVHDIGKLSIPAEILSKPSALTHIEFSIIKQHPERAHQILKEIDFPWPIADIVLQHHERLDGSGYPKGLESGEILLEARILAVADVVEAISTHRPYRPAIGIDLALEEIDNNKGRLYDTDVVNACLRLFREKGLTL